MTTAPASRRTLLALTACFIAFGVVANTLFARQPSFQDMYALDNGEWGWVLFALGLGGLSAFPLNRWLLARWGSQVLIRRAGTAQGLWLIALGWLPGLPGLLVGLFVHGTLFNAINTAINSQAAQLEANSGQRMMGRLHAVFYLGTTVSALVSGVLVASGLPLRAHLLLVGLLILLCFRLAARPLMPAKAQAEPTRGFALPAGPVLAIGGLTACAAIAEGGLNGWIPLYLHRALGTSESVAAFGLAGFTGAMMVGRFLADGFAERFGPVRLVSTGATMAGLALALAVWANSLPMMLVALVITGLGQAATFPLAFSAAGRLGGDAIPGVASMGSGGSLIGPFLLGRVAATLSLPAVVLTVSGGLLLVASQARALRQRPSNPAS